MVAVTHVARGSLTHCLLWAQKAEKQHSKCVLDASKAGVAYLGPTPLSRFVCEKGKSFRDEMVELLKDEAYLDAGPYSLVFD